MSQLQPLNTTVQDICTAALREAGVVGIGQTPTAQDITDAWTRLQWMLQEWNEDRYYVYHLVTKVIPTSAPLTDANGVSYYPVGPGAGSLGGFETGQNTGSAPNEVATSQRPQEVNSCFLRQLTNGIPGTNQLIVAEQVNVLGVNTLAPLSRPADGVVLEIIVNGTTFLGTGSNPSFSFNTSGGQTTITWTSGSFTINPGDLVYAVYSY